MKDAPEAELQLPPQLVLLRRLVIGLLVVMILGFVVLIATLVTRIAAKPPVLPAEISLPEGEKGQAFTMGEDWYAIVTEAGRILIYDRDSQELLQNIQIRP